MGLAWGPSANHRLIPRNSASSPLSAAIPNKDPHIPFPGSETLLYCPLIAPFITIFDSTSSRQPFQISQIGDGCPNYMSLQHITHLIRAAWSYCLPLYWTGSTSGPTQPRSLLAPVSGI